MTMKVYEAINAVQAELAATGIAKGQVNTYDSYKFRGIDDVYNALAPVMAKHKLCIIPRMVERHVTERVSRDNKALFYVTVTAEFDLVSAEDGSKHTGRTFGEAMDRGDKATNKAMSAAYKYFAFQTFVIPIDTDDGDIESPAVKPATATAVEGVKVTKEERAGLAIIAKTLVDLVLDEEAELTDHAAEIWKRIKPIYGSEKHLVLWKLLDGHSNVRSRVKRVAEAMRAVDTTEATEDADAEARKHIREMSAELRAKKEKAT